MSARALLGLAVLLAGCASEARPSGQATSSDETDAGADATPLDARQETAARLAEWLEGRFDSTAQAKRDPSYFGISLVTCRADAPELGERAIYVEQAKIGATPYRQRLYVVEPIDDTAARSRVYELVSPEPAVGLCDRKEPRTFRKADVITREGCDVEMRWVSDRFIGHTPDARWNGRRFEPAPDGRRCPSDLNGATHATSEVELRADRLTSWDRGFDDEDTQRWGAEKGPYEFIRRSPLPHARAK